MVNISSWLEIFSEHLDATFHGRVWFMGLQGSYARGEAKETSDIDVVVILDSLHIGKCSTSFRNAKKYAVSSQAVRR